MEADRWNRVVWGPLPHGTRRMRSKRMWNEPYKWNEEARKSGKPWRVFASSVCDIFEDWQGDILAPGDTTDIMWVDDEEGEYIRLSCDADASHRLRKLTMNDLRLDFFDMVARTPYLTWLVLTKRPGNVPEMMPLRPGMPDFIGDRPGLNRNPDHVGTVCLKWDNIWLGTSISEQKSAEKNAPILLAVKDRCDKVFLSAEPLLSGVNLAKWLPELDWVIWGGESGPWARECCRGWIDAGIRQTQRFGTACFFKQAGSRYRDVSTHTYGKLVPGDDLPSNAVKLVDYKGGDLSELPQGFAVREFPGEMQS